MLGLLSTSAEGFCYLFTLVDRSTRWVEAVPIKTMSAVDCVDALITAWVSRFGVPANLTSDRGAQFTAAVWSALCLKLGVSHQITTAYHPQSNSMGGSGLIDSLRTPFVPASQGCNGSNIFLGSFWASGRHPRRIQASLWRNWLMAPLSLYLASSSLQRSRLQLLLWRRFVLHLCCGRPGCPPMRKWRPSRLLPSWRQSSCLSGEAGLFLRVNTGGG